MRLATERFFDDFYGNGAFPVVASVAGAPWVSYIKKTAGAPTMLGLTAAPGGVQEGLLEATNEVQIASLYWGDILSLLADNIQLFAFRMRAAAIAANQVLCAGLSSARNDTYASATYACNFRIDGANAAPTTIAVDTKDGTTTNSNSKSELLLPAATWLDFVIDFANGLGDVRFFAGDSAHNGHLTRLSPKTTYDCSKLAGHYLQPNFQLQKASGTGVPYMDIDYVEILYKRS